MNWRSNERISEWANRQIGESLVKGIAYDNLTGGTEKLTFWQKAAYGIGVLGSAVGPGTIIPFWYSIFLTDIVRMDLKLVGLFWLVVTLWDAVNDPLFGFLSDRTRSRWGRRRPYLLFGAVPFGVFFALLWVIPQRRTSGAPCILHPMYILYERQRPRLAALQRDHAGTDVDPDERVAGDVPHGGFVGDWQPLLLGWSSFRCSLARSAQTQTIGAISGPRSSRRC